MTETTKAYYRSMSLKNLLAPTLTLKLGLDLVANGEVRFAEGEIVRARLTHSDHIGENVQVWDPGDETRQVNCTLKDLAWAEVEL